MAPTTWLFEFTHALRGAAADDPAAVNAHFDFYVDLWTAAEAAGWDGVMFSEHHFGGGYAPSPNLFMATLAARTKSLRIGVLGSVGPYATPWRVAEEFAMLSHLTHGRLEMGVVSGIPPEFMTAGLSIPEVGERHAEVCAVLDAARSNSGPVTHHGKHWSFDNLALLPPFRTPNAPVWTAVRGADSARRAAARGWKIATGFNSVENLKAVTQAYRDTAAEAGHEVGPDHLGLRRMVTFVDRPDQASEGRLRGKQGLKEVLEASAGPLPPFAAILDRPDDENEMLANDEFIAGTPEQVAEQLLNQAGELGAGHIMVMFSEVEPSALARAHQIFAAEVLPKLRG